MRLALDWERVRWRGATWQPSWKFGDKRSETDQSQKVTLEERPLRAISNNWKSETDMRSGTDLSQKVTLGELPLRAGSKSTRAQAPQVVGRRLDPRGTDGDPDSTGADPQVPPGSEIAIDR